MSQEELKEELVKLLQDAEKLAASYDLALVRSIYPAMKA